MARGELGNNPAIRSVNDKSSLRNRMLAGALETVRVRAGLWVDTIELQDNNGTKVCSESTRNQKSNNDSS